MLWGYAAALLCRHATLPGVSVGAIPLRRLPHEHSERAPGLCSARAPEAPERARVALVALTVMRGETMLLGALARRCDESVSPTPRRLDSTHTSTSQTSPHILLTSPSNPFSRHAALSNGTLRSTLRAAPTRSTTLAITTGRTHTCSTARSSRMCSEASYP